MKVRPFHESGDYLGPRARLIEIDRLVRKGGYPSCARLARHMGVSSKTVQRDVDYLRYSLNAPLAYDESLKGWHYTDATFFLPAAAVTERDVFALYVAQKAVEQYAGTPMFEPLRKAFARILQVVPEGSKVECALVADRIRFAGPPPTVVQSEVWDAIIDALRDERTVKMTYGMKETTDRDVDPYALIVHDGNWYLYGHCHLRNSRRTFFLPRVRRAKLTSDYFETPEDFHLEEYVRGGFEGLRYESDRKVRVRLRFTKEVSAAAAERPWHESEKQTCDRYGRLTISFETDALVPVRAKVLSWGAAIEVLAPRALREWVRDEVRATVRVYEAGRR